MNPPEMIDRLCRENINLAYFIIRKLERRYRLTSEEAIENLESDALYGLFRAAMTYREDLGRFGPWAGRHIEGRILVRFKDAKRLRIIPDSLISSLGLPTGERETDTLGDLIPDDRVDVAATAAARATTDQALAGLCKRDRLVLTARSRGSTLADVGRMLGGLTRERVRQIEIRALRRARAALEPEPDPEPTPEDEQAAG